MYPHKDIHSHCMTLLITSYSFYVKNNTHIASILSLAEFCLGFFCLLNAPDVILVIERKPDLDPPSMHVWILFISDLVVLSCFFQLSQLGERHHCINDRQIVGGIA